MAKPEIHARKEKRNYQQEYQNESKQRREARAERNQARRIMVKEGKAKVGDGKDVGHVRAIGKGGTNALANLEMQNPSHNRSFNRNSKHKMTSEISPIEKKQGRKGKY